MLSILGYFECYPRGNPRSYQNRVLCLYHQLCKLAEAVEGGHMATISALAIESFGNGLVNSFSHLGLLFFFAFFFFAAA